MIQALLRRKIKFGRSKGVSTVIGTIFFVIVALLIYVNIFMWTVSQNSVYSQYVIQSHQMDADRFSERIIISQGNYSVAGDKVRVDALLTNEGPVSVQILTLWVVDNTIGKYGFNNTIRSLNINLNPGDSRSVSGEVIIPGTGPDHAFDVWFVTARGNMISFEKARYVTVSTLTEAMGPILLDYNSLRWYSTDTGNSGTWQVSRSETSLEWSINVTNWGDEDIKLSYDSIFMIFSEGQSMVWYIKQEYVLVVNEEVNVTFCWDRPNSGKYITSQLPPAGTYAVYIVLIGTHTSGKHYGQTIPFVAVKVV